MILHKIKINNFRFFTSVVVDFINSLTIIIGPNASGKTTLLRAINFLKSCRKMQFENNYNYYLKDIKLTPSIEYHLNPLFFGIENKNTPIIFKCSPDKSEITNITSFNDTTDSRSLIELIEDKLEIVFWDSSMLIEAKGRSYFSSGEIITNEIKKLSENTKNKLILLDDIFLIWNLSRKVEISNLFRQLAKNNQIILTTTTPIPKDFLDDYEKIAFSRDGLLTQYLGDSVRGNSKFYNSFIENIENIERLMSISISQANLLITLNKMLYLNVIIAMETYLSDAFINTVVNNKDLIKRLLEKSSDFQKKKFNVFELITWLNDMNKSAEEYLLNITYHNIWRVKDMYKNVLSVEFSENIEYIQNAVMIRHDIVHRNGKTKEGIEIKIKREDIIQIIEKVKEFIKIIDDQIAHLKLNEIYLS